MFFLHFSFILTSYPDISILHACENASKTRIRKDRNLTNIFHERIILEKHPICFSFIFVVHKSWLYTCRRQTSTCRLESNIRLKNMAKCSFWLVLSLWTATPSTFLPDASLPWIRVEAGRSHPSSSAEPTTSKAAFQPQPRNHRKHPGDQTPTAASVADTQQVWADVWWRLHGLDPRRHDTKSNKGRRNTAHSNQ